MSSSEDTLNQDKEIPRFNVNARLIVIPSGIRSEFNYSKYLDVKRIIPGVFLARKANKKLREKLTEFQHLRFMKAKEIPKSDSRRLIPFQERIFTIVVYSFDKASAQQKKGIQRLLVKAPSIRIRPGVLLFPQLRSKERARYYSDSQNGEILDSKLFYEQTKLIGAKVIRWTRLRPANKITIDHINQSFDKMMRHDIEIFDEKINQIKLMIGDPSVSTISLKQQHKSLTTRYRKMKLKYATMKAIWQYDSEKHWKRIYNRLLKIRREIDDRRV